MREHVPRQPKGPAGPGFGLRAGTLSSPAGLRLLCLLTEATTDALRAGEIYPPNESRRARSDDPDLGRLEGEVGAFVRRVYAEVSPTLMALGGLERSDVDQALLQCALQWVDLPCTNSDIGRREWLVTQAVVAGLTEFSGDGSLRLRGARALHRLIDESLWWDFRCARYAGSRIVAGFLEERWSCDDFDGEQLEQIYTSIQVQGEAESEHQESSERSYFRACTLHQVARRTAVGAQDEDLVRIDQVPLDSRDIAWLKENLAIAELFRGAIDTAESRRDVAVICYKLGCSSQAGGAGEDCAAWLRRGLAALRPGMAARRGLVPDLEGALSARIQSLLGMLDP